MQEAILLIILTDAALNHFRQNLFRLRLLGSLILLDCLRHQDLTFFRQDLLRNLGLIHISRTHSCGLHADILTKLKNGLVALEVIRHRQPNQYTDNAAHMGIRDVHSRIIITVKAADLDILANGEHLFLERALNGEVAQFASLECVNIHRGILHHDTCQIGNKLLEIRILRNKVSFRVDLNNCANAAVGADRRADNALSRDTASLFGSLREALLTQKLNRLIEIAVSLLERLLTIHHAYAGLLAQLFYISSSKCHFLFLQ